MTRFVAVVVLIVRRPFGKMFPNDVRLGLYVFLLFYKCLLADLCEINFNVVRTYRETSLKQFA